MADIEKASLYMAAADTAATAIESILNDQVADVIVQCRTEGKITRAKEIALRKRCESVGAKIVSLALDLHDHLKTEAEAIGEDVPPPSDGNAELIAVIQGMVKPLSGGR